MVERYVNQLKYMWAMVGEVVSDYIVFGMVWVIALLVVGGLRLVITDRGLRIKARK